MLKKKKVVFVQPCPEVVEDQERDQGRWTLLRNVNQVLKPTTMLAVRKGVPSPEHGWKLSGCFEICLAVDGILVLLTPASLTFLLCPPPPSTVAPLQCNLLALHIWKFLLKIFFVNCVDLCALFPRLAPLFGCQCPQFVRS